MKRLDTELTCKELKEVSGIYKIQCKNRVYVGSSKSLYSRLKEHRSRLHNDQHSNDLLQKCWNKYGPDFFTYEIIEFCDPEIRIVREKFWIDTLKPEFNLQLDPISKTLSVYSKQKLSKSIKAGYAAGKYILKVTKSPVEMYDHFGNFLYEFKNSDEAIEKTGIAKHKLLAACSGYGRGRLASAFRFRWKLSKSKPKKFKFATHMLTRAYNYFVVTPEGEKLIEGNIRDLNNFFAQQILNGNWEIAIKIRPKTKVPFKLCELLEQLEKANQQPIPVRNSGQVQRLDKVCLPGSAEVEISTSAKNTPMSTKT